MPTWPEGTPAAQIAADLGYTITEEPRAAAVATEPLSEVLPVRDYAPAAWYEQPDWIDAWREEHGAGSDRVAGLRRLTITDEGRVGGWFYDAGACIFGTGDTACPTPSPTNYAAFHQQETVTDEGTIVLVGAVGNSAGHVDRNMPLREALDVYNNPKIQLMRLRAGDSPEGGWVAGSLVPAGARIAAGVDPLTWGSLNFLRSCAMSGSWYPTAPGGFDRSWWERNQVPHAVAAAAEWYDSIGPQLVTRPALALMRSVKVAAVDKPIIVGGWGGVAFDPDDECAECAEEPTMTASADPNTNTSGVVSTTTSNAAPDVRALEERVEAMEQERRQEREAAQAEATAALRERVDTIAPPVLPAPPGFEERTAQLTDADREHLTRMAAAGAPPFGGGGLPQIANEADLNKAKASVAKAPPAKKAALIAHINRRAKALGLPGIGNTAAKPTA